MLAGLVLALSGCAKKVAETRPSDAVAQAWQDYKLGEFDRAAAAFERVAEATAATDGLHAQALYGAACVWHLRRPGEDAQKAEKLFKRVIEAAPGHDLAAWSRLALARMKHLVPVGEDPDMQAVRAAYGDVIARHPEHLAAREAFLYLQSTLVATLEEAPTRQAVQALEEFVRGPRPEFVAPAWSLLAVAYTTLGRQEERLRAEIRALETTEVDPGNPFTEFAWAYWNIATIAEFEVGDFDLARRYYGRLLAEYPRDIRVFGARQALGRMDALEAKLRVEAPRP
jgi:tetratricopeptide (TPR) repeat protein